MLLNRNRIDDNLHIGLNGASRRGQMCTLFELPANSQWSKHASIQFGGKFEKCTQWRLWNSCSKSNKVKHKTGTGDFYMNWQTHIYIYKLSTSRKPSHLPRDWEIRNFGAWKLGGLGQFSCKCLNYGFLLCLALVSIERN